jgi:glycosyltransferase involved in cell wall biosynthesis
LIQALKIVSTSVSDVQLLIVGEKNKYAERMLELTSGSALEGRVIFTGWLTGHELHYAYHAAALVATPSVCFDSFIMVNLEGMACRKPAVTTCFGGSKEVVEDGKTGYVVNPHNVPDMAEKIAGLLGDTQKARSFGETGHTRATSQFSLAECARMYEEEFSKKR